VSLKYNRVLPAAAGSFALSGQDVALIRASAMIAAAGGFSIVGQDVDLVYTQGNAYSLAADPGSFAMAGDEVALLKGFHLAVGVGAFSLVGQDVAFPRDYRIASLAGAYSFQGRPVSLVYSGAAPAGAKDTYIVGLRRRRRT
jgi:fructose-1,6-bisphosphatase